MSGMRRLTARAQDVPWSEIGTRMGVSKQAAQHRLAKAAQVELEPLSPEQGFTRFTVEARNLLMAAHEAARTRKEAVVTPARLAVAAGIRSEEVRLPKPAAEAKELVPYDQGAQRVLSRAFDVAITQGADMVNVSHVLEALTEALPTTV